IIPLIILIPCCFSTLLTSLPSLFFFLNDPPPPESSPLSLHDALPIYRRYAKSYDQSDLRSHCGRRNDGPLASARHFRPTAMGSRSEEHTSELQSLTNIVCRLLLEKKKTKHKTII